MGCFLNKDIFVKIRPKLVTLVYNIPKLINEGIINNDGETWGSVFFM